MGRVGKIIEECMLGNVSTHYHTGHPHAFLNVMYMGEISICKILTDPMNQLSKLKAKTKPYPQALKHAIIGCFIFEASFSLMFAKDNIDKDDISYVAGHCFRSISCMNQVLFAMNEEYCINEKKAVRMINGFPIKPQEYKKRIDQIITLISADVNGTQKGIDMLEKLVSEIEEIEPL